MAIGLEAVTARKAKKKEIKKATGRRPQSCREVKFRLENEAFIEENETWLSLTESCGGSPKESAVLKFNSQWTELERLLIEAVYQRNASRRLLTLLLKKSTDQK